MTSIKTLTIAATLAMTLPVGSAIAKPSLRDVPEIEDALFAVAIADEVRDYCGTIHARMFKAIGTLRRLKARANELGYSDSEIRKYIESDTEKARMRAKGKKFLAANGVSYSKPETFCTFGRAEISKSSAIGVLLKAK